MSVYGSSFTGFGLKESDINLDLVIPEEVSTVHTTLDSGQQTNSAGRNARRSTEIRCNLTTSFTAAAVPIEINNDLSTIEKTIGYM